MQLRSNSPKILCNFCALHICAVLNGTSGAVFNHLQELVMLTASHSLKRIRSQPINTHTKMERIIVN